jgi:hypothetical protein
LSLMRHAASFGPDNDVIHPPPAFVPKIPAATLSLAGSQATPPLHLPCSSCFFFTYPRFAICSGSQARLPQAECRHRWGAPMAGCGAAEVSRSRMDFCCSGEAVPPHAIQQQGTSCWLVLGVIPLFAYCRSGLDGGGLHSYNLECVRDRAAVAALVTQNMVGKHRATGETTSSSSD